MTDSCYLTCLIPSSTCTCNGTRPAIFPCVVLVSGEWRVGCDMKFFPHLSSGVFLVPFTCDLLGLFVQFFPIWIFSVFSLAVKIHVATVRRCGCRNISLILYDSLEYWHFWLAVRLVSHSISFSNLSQLWLHRADFRLKKRNGNQSVHSLCFIGHRKFPT